MDGWPQGTLAIVEDSDSDFVMFSRVFRSSGPIPRWSTAEDALAAFTDGAPDLADLSLLVVDLHLPGIDGVALIERARQLPGGTTPTICMLSSSERAEDQERARRAGADGYIVKPNDLSGLRALPGQFAALAAAR